jgi:uncharacterized membrane protein
VIRADAGRPPIAALALALLGAAVAGYLTWVHYADSLPVCVGGSGGCERVQSSDQSELVGIPVAVIGLVNYLLIAAGLLLRTDGARLVATALALVGFGFSAYLTYVELFVIDAICQWCVANAIIATALAAVVTAGFLRE